ncbi:MAG TPA: YciI family protein [Terriglobales bacterium]|jgi:hypothetical protein|nr:YciI family protein [Terriglobales bacterium]
MATPNKYYVAFFEISYRSLDEVKSKEPQSLAAHLARSRELHRQGKVLMAGAFLDRPDEPLNTMGVFTSREDAEEYVKGDPFVLSGAVTNWYIREWANILG